IGAAVAKGDDAELLGLADGAAVLLCRRTTFAEDGTPVLHSEHVFAGERTEFVVELPRADRSMAPSGLRLVE
ncbi:MAG TPA: UTRA domain-containing protein, partial [Acidimicrobiales bacterium]|nr:UTRA domain-containing protein [Acidimicrobiales bacterium]